MHISGRALFGRTGGVRVCAFIALSGLVATGIAACGEKPSPSVLASAPDAEVATPAANVERQERYGHCSIDDSDSVDRPSPLDAVASVGQWLRLEPKSADYLRTLVERDETQDLKLPVSAIDSIDARAATESRDFRIHGSALPGVVAALDDGNQVVLGVSSSNDASPNYTRIALVFADDGSVFFAGDCHRSYLYEPLRKIHGDRFASTLRAAVGKTGTDLQAILQPSPPPTLDTIVRLNPQSASAELLDSLAHARLTMSVPEDWAAPLTICTKIPAGWNDCIESDWVCRRLVRLVSHAALA